MSADDVDGDRRRAARHRCPTLRPVVELVDSLRGRSRAHSGSPATVRASVTTFRWPTDVPCSVERVPGARTVRWVVAAHESVNDGQIPIFPRPWPSGARP